MCSEVVELSAKEIDFELLTPEEMDWILADERLDGLKDGWFEWMDRCLEGRMDEYIMNLPWLTREEMDNILMDGF